MWVPPGAGSQLRMNDEPTTNADTCQRLASSGKTLHYGAKRCVRETYSSCLILAYLCSTWIAGAVRVRCRNEDSESAAVLYLSCSCLETSRTISRLRMSALVSCLTQGPCGGLESTTSPGPRVQRGVQQRVGASLRTAQVHSTCIRRRRILKCQDPFESGLTPQPRE